MTGVPTPESAFWDFLAAILLIVVAAILLFLLILCFGGFTGILASIREWKRGFRPKKKDLKPMASSQETSNGSR